MADLTYSDGMLVEKFDHVEVSLDGGAWIFDGQVKQLFPRLREVAVCIEDHRSPRRDGEPTKRTIRVSMSSVDLVRRDG